VLMSVTVKTKNVHSGYTMISIGPETKYPKVPFRSGFEENRGLDLKSYIIDA